MDFGVQRGVVETVTQAEAQLVIALGGFQVKRLPVDAHEMRFAGGDGEVGAARFDLDAGGLHTRDVDRKAHGSGLLAAVVARLTEGAMSGIRAARTTAGGTAGFDDRMHGRKSVEAVNG